MKLIEPKHRCQKCKTPLEFEYCHERTEEERDKFIEQLNFTRWDRFFISSWDYWTDKNKQTWGCPKCYESYLIYKKE